MKVTGATAVGLVIALLILYWIRPVSATTVGLVTLICCGVAAGVAWLMTKKDKTGGKA